jgi:hypothetical protein
MNNEPVAWMFQGAFDISTYVSFEKPNPDIYPNPTPLYTHPVKEQDTDCQYCKQGCIRCDARKQLTDEEIDELANKYLYVLNDVPYANDIKEFARAILRKAQEK